VPQSLQKPDALWKFERVDCDQTELANAPVSCWGGFGDGATLSVRTYKATDDISQGTIAVCLGFYPCGLGSTYKSPLKLGTLNIVSIDGNLVSLTPDDGQTTLIFDLQTRQWVPPSTINTRPLTTGQVPCNDYAGSGIEYFGCWQGSVAGETIQLRIGRESGGKNDSLDKAKLNCCKGIIVVGQYGHNASGKYGYYTTTYTTTEQTSAFYLVSIKGERITLASYDPHFKGKAWVFDLNERKWIDP
jgi:hypothetical protein